MLNEHKKNKSRFTTVSKQYLSVDKNEDIIRQYYPEFIRLYKEGIIGGEHRLNWIETLRSSSERIKLLGLTYSISPQEKHSPQFNINLGRFMLYGSTMKLGIDMLHEEDLLSLIKDINKHAEGMFTVTECIFTRKNKILVKSYDAKNIRADCELQWLNIKMGDGSEIKIS